MLKAVKTKVVLIHGAPGEGKTALADAAAATAESRGAIEQRATINLSDKGGWQGIAYDDTMEWLAEKCLLQMCPREIVRVCIWATPCPVRKGNSADTVSTYLVLRYRRASTGRIFKQCWEVNGACRDWSCTTAPRSS